MRGLIIRTPWIEKILAGAVNNHPAAFAAIDTIQVHLKVSYEGAVLRPFILDGIWPRTVADRESVKITAELPDGNVEPLLWLYECKKQYGHPFLLRTPLQLPAGTVIRGIPSNSSFVLLPLEPAN